jgi:hypothetical protein
MSRKTNRDHAKRQQLPIIEDHVISGQIEALSGQSHLISVKEGGAWFLAV